MGRKTRECRAEAHARKKDNAVGESERGSESKARRFLRRQCVQPVGRHRENTEVVIGIIKGEYCSPFFFGGSRNPLPFVCDAGECHIVRPALPKPTRLQAELAALHRRTAKQGCASKSDSQSHISGTGECGHITLGHSTPTLAQRLVGGVTCPCSILPTYSIGCTVRKATCTHAPLRPVSHDPAFALSIGTKPRLLLCPKAEALAVTPHKGAER